MRALLSMLVLLGSCDAGPVDPPRDGSLLITNESQYDLVELRVHPHPDYLEVSNLAETGLAISGQIVFFGKGKWYVTAFRERYRRGPILAFTTSRPIEVAAEQGVRLIVFDESFRLEESTWIDPGPTDP